MSRLGAIPQLAAPAIGGAGLRAANGFLLFSIAFALRRSGEPTYWFAVLAGGAALGSFLGDVLAPRLPVALREEAVVVACIVAAGIGAFLAFVAFSLPILTAFALVAGASSELGRLAFQSLMQQLAPDKKQQLQSEQRAWLAQREKQCVIYKWWVDCLTEMYGKRIEELRK